MLQTFCSNVHISVSHSVMYVCDTICSETTEVNFLSAKECIVSILLTKDLLVKLVFCTMVLSVVESTMIV